MTFVKQETFPILKKNNQLSKISKTIYFLKCDYCGKIFEDNDKHRKNKPLHFCSRKCADNSNSDGLIRDKKKENSIKNFGVDHPSKNELVQEKIRKTNIEKYGVDNVFKSEIIKDKIKQTIFEKYGYEYITQVEEVKQKMTLSLIETYGVDHPMRSQEIKNKFDFQDIAVKSHETKKRNGSYGKSKEENKLYELLVKYFGQEDIIQQYRVNSWAIDFYILSLNVFINYNGAYYHGLDRPIEFIKNSENKLDQNIYQTYLRDIERVNYFKENNIKYFVITNYDIKKYTEEEIIELIKIV